MISRPKIGFVGCGHHASTNLYPALRLTNAEFAAACDLWDNRRAEARRLGVPRVYDRAEDMLAAESLDAVFISGPAEVHHEVGLQALARGLHVFVEKPPAPSVAAARELDEAARRAGKVLMTGFMKRFAQKYVLAREIAARPSFGATTHLLVRYSHGARMAAKPDGAWQCLLQMTIHPLDLLFHLLGRPVRVQFERVLVASGTAHQFAAHFTFPSGALGTLVSNATAPCATERLEWTGEGEHLVVDEVATLEHYARAESPWAPPVKTVHAPNFPLQVQANHSLELQGYAGEVRAFVQAVEQGLPSPVPMADAVFLLQVCEILAHAEPGSHDLTHL